MSKVSNSFHFCVGLTGLECGFTFNVFPSRPWHVPGVWTRTWPGWISEIWGRYPTGPWNTCRFDMVWWLRILGHTRISKYPWISWISGIDVRFLFWISFSPWFSWNLRQVTTALECGYRVIDTAQRYGGSVWNWTWRSSIKNRPNFHQFVDELRKWGGHWPGIVSSFRRRSRKARRSVCDNQGWDCDFRTGWQLSTRPLILGRCGLPTTATRRQLNPSRPSSARWDEFADNPWQSNLSEGQNFDAFSTLSDKISHLLEAFEALILEPSATNAIPDPKLPRPGIGEKNWAWSLSIWSCPTGLASVLRLSWHNRMPYCGSKPGKPWKICKEKLEEKHDETCNSCATSFTFFHFSFIFFLWTEETAVKLETHV